MYIEPNINIFNVINIMNTINTVINVTNATTISSSNTHENFFATSYFIIIVVSVIVLIFIVILATVSYVLMTQKDDTISPATKSGQIYSESVSNSTPITTNGTSGHGQTMSEFHIALTNFNNKQRSKKMHVPANSADIDNLSDIDEEDEVMEVKPKSPKSPKYKTVSNKNNNSKMDENDSDDESSLSINTDSDMRENDNNINNKWICPLCTYENDINGPKCEMCLTPKPLSFEYDYDYKKQKPPPKFQTRIKPLPPPRKPTSPKRPYITKV